MKNKLKIFLCVVMILVFSFGTCATAYAYTGYPKSLDKATSVVKSYYKDDDLNYIFGLFKNPDGKVVLITFGGNSFLFGNDKVLFSGYPFSPDCKLLFNGQYYDSLDMLHVYSYAYEFDYDNFYSKPKKITNIDHLDIVRKDYLALPYLSNYSLIESNYNIYEHTDTGDDVLVFQKGTSQSPNPNPPTPPSASDSNILSTIFNKNSEMLKGVLTEIVALLPLFLPVLISFLAIRKGIKFTLRTLRSS